MPIADTSVTKKHVVLDGDIPSAMNPPSGCPFQTRCQYKKQVPGNRCEVELPAMLVMATGHQIKCHLSQAVFDGMEPVIKMVAAE